MGTGVTKDRRPVLQAIESAMASFGWPLRRVCALPPCYARDSAVTPYFVCSNLARRRFGCYYVEGGIGVIHSGFERVWAQRYPGDPSERRFGVLLYTANFRELAHSAYIVYEGPVETAAGQLCASIVSILQRLPADENELFDAVERDDFAGHRVDDYSGGPHNGKFNAFKAFVKQRFQHH